MQIMKQGLVEFFITFFISLFLFYCAIFVIDFFISENLKIYAWLAQGLILQLIFLVVIYKRYNSNFDLGLESISAISALKIVMLSIFIAISLWYVSFHFSVNQPTQEYKRLAILYELNPYQIFYVIALAPILEEVIWRGYAYPCIKKSIGKFFSIIIISIIFALLHVAKRETHIVEFLYSLFFTWLVSSIRDKINTSACIIFHAFYNLTPLTLRLLRG